MCDLFVGTFPLIRGVHLLVSTYGRHPLMGGVGGVWKLKVYPLMGGSAYRSLPLP